MNGIIPIWKERGMTSHDCVFKARKILKTKKIGHSGTLDPNVDGVLPIGIGKGTKVIEYMMDSKKVYTGEVTIGFSTTTEDLDGDVVEQVSLQSTEILDNQIEDVLKQFEGNITQIPPMYSAVKVNGKRLYEYARNNEDVKRPKREVTIHSLNKTSELSYDKDNQNFSFHFKVECSKGTYIRTLAVDIGKALGYPACMTQLTRVESAGYTKNESITLEKLDNLFNENEINQVIKPIETALRHLNRYNLSEDDWLKVKHGALLEKANYGEDYPLAVFYKDLAIAIYDVHPSKTHYIKPKKVFRTEL